MSIVSSLPVLEAASIEETKKSTITTRTDVIVDNNANEETSAVNNSNNAQPQEDEAFHEIVHQVSVPAAPAKIAVISDPHTDVSNNANEDASVAYSVKSKSTKRATTESNFFTNLLHQFSALFSSETKSKTTLVEETELRVPHTKYLLPPRAKNTPKKCLVLDLDETLVHSFGYPTNVADFILPLDVDGMIHPIYVAKRPGVDEFLRECAKHYEIVVFTASLSKYANPLLDKLDPTHTLISHRLFREHCVNYYGAYVKDLSLLGRPLSQTVIVDNSPVAYTFHYKNALPCTSFFDNREDRELYGLMNFLRAIKNDTDIRSKLEEWRYANEN